MTEYPVQCYNNNGEPYGKYVNPHTWLFETYADSITSECPAEILYENYNFHDFEVFAEANTFPFPSGTIGKTYQRNEVEVIYQYFAEWNGIKEWFYCNKEWFDAINRKSVCPTRQIFRLVISKTETATQPAEKEPETLISSRQYIEEVYGTSTFARSIECKDAESIMDMMDDFLDWAMQKKQEATR